MSDSAGCLGLSQVLFLEALWLGEQAFPKNAGSVLLWKNFYSRVELGRSFLRLLTLRAVSYHRAHLSVGCLLGNEVGSVQRTLFQEACSKDSKVLILENMVSKQV